LRCEAKEEGARGLGEEKQATLNALVELNSKLKGAWGNELFKE
jgi:hypothetical protein